MVLKKIISGGQTGADQGALDGAISMSFCYGGAIPAGRKTEAGPLSKHYHMVELSSSSYPARTVQNVKDGDGTLVVSYGRLTGGSALTVSTAHSCGKPCFHLDFKKYSLENGVSAVTSWLKKHDIEILNVAGARLSSCPEIYDQTRRLIIMLIEKEISGHD